MDNVTTVVGIPSKEALWPPWFARVLTATTGRHAVGMNSWPIFRKADLNYLYVSNMSVVQT